MSCRIICDYSEEKMKGHGAASCQLTRVLLHPTPSWEPPEHNLPNATDMLPPTRTHTTPTSALFMDVDCASAFSQQTGHQNLSLHRQRPRPYFWTSASLLQVNNHCPTRWQPSSQFKILLIFRYLTNINTGESQYLSTISLAPIPQEHNSVWPLMQEQQSPASC